MTHQDALEADSYYENPLAFWLAPDRWDGIDPYKQCFWEVERSTVSPEITSGSGRAGPRCIGGYGQGFIKAANCSIETRNGQFTTPSIGMACTKIGQNFVVWNNTTGIYFHYKNDGASGKFIRLVES
jgi:hypothetical protein